MDASNNTVDEELEIENFKAAGKILAEIWSVIDGHPVVARWYRWYIDPEDRTLDSVVSEERKSKHVMQSQYMLQIVKCKDKSCCKFRTNYLTYFPQRFFPPPVPLKSTTDGVEVSEGRFGYPFQAIVLSKYANRCFNKFCPSLQKVDKKRQDHYRKTHLLEVQKIPFHHEGDDCSQKSVR